MRPRTSAAHGELACHHVVVVHPVERCLVVEQVQLQRRLQAVHDRGTPSAHHRHTIGTQLAHHWHTIGTPLAPASLQRCLALGRVHWQGGRGVSTCSSSIFFTRASCVSSVSSVSRLRIDTSTSVPTRSLGGLYSSLPGCGTKFLGAVSSMVTLTFGRASGWFGSASSFSTTVHTQSLRIRSDFLVRSWMRHTAPVVTSTCVPSCEARACG